MGKIARSPVDVMLGEMAFGVSDATRYRDLQAIASVISNRSVALGVTPQQVVGNQRQFNAYGKALPPGASSYRDLAEAAWADVQENGPTHAGTFYATPAAVGNLPKGLVAVDEVEGGHRYFEDPHERAIATAVGNRAPIDIAAARAAAAQRLSFETATINEEGMPTPEARPDLMPANALASNRVAVAPIPGPTVESWSAMAAAQPMDAVNGVQPDVAAAASRMGDLAAPISTPADLSAAMSRMNTPASNPIDVMAAMDSAIAESVNASAAAKTDRLAGNVAAGIDPGRMADNAPMSAADQALQGMMQETAQANVYDRFAPAPAPATMSMPAKAFENIAAAGIQPGFSDTLAATGVPARSVPSLSITPGMISSPEALSAALSALGGQAVSQPSLGINSPEHQALAANVEKNLADMQAASDVANAEGQALSFDRSIAEMAAPNQVAQSNMAEGLQAARSVVEAPAQVAAKTERLAPADPLADALAASAANPNLMSAQSLTTVSPSLTTAPTNNALTTSVGVRNNAFMPDLALFDPSLQDALPAVQPAAVAEVQAPALEQISIPSQPTIAAPVDITPATTTSAAVPTSVSNMPAVQTRQSTAMDVWGGRAATGIATDGSTVSKMDDGRIGRFDPKHNQTMFTADQGATWSSPVSGNQLTPSVQPTVNQSFFSKLASVLSGVASPTGVATRGTDGGMNVGRDGPAGTPGGGSPDGGSGPTGGYGSTGGKDPEGTK